MAWLATVPVFVSVLFLKRNTEEQSLLHCNNNNIIIITIIIIENIDSFQLVDRLAQLAVLITIIVDRFRDQTRLD